MDVILMLAKGTRWLKLLPLVWVTLSVAQPVLPVAELIGDEVLMEVLSDEVPVSGRVVAGVALVGMSSSSDMSLYAMPEDTRGKICVQVMSRDGRYWSENDFRSRPGGVGGEIVVRYDSLHADELHEFGADNVAILSYPGECGEQDSNVYLPGSFGERTTAEPLLKIFVNSARADTFLRVYRRENSTTLKCQRITEGRRTGYDTVCQTQLQPQDYEARLINLKIYRRKYERSFDPEPLLVRLPLAPGDAS